jgi:hypothetical protein
MQFSETFKRPSGFITMIEHRGGHVVNDQLVDGELVARRDFHNLIVDSASRLMAGRMAPGSITGGSEQSRIGSFLDHGIQYLAVGFGRLVDPTQPYDAVTNPVDPSYDLQNPPVETLADVTLLGEAYRVPPSTWCFLDGAGEETSQNTNVLKISFTLMENEAVGPITELGLYGGDAQPWNAGQGKNTGLLFNRKVFAVWNKSVDTRLTVSWKLTF